MRLEMSRTSRICPELGSDDFASECDDRRARNFLTCCYLPAVAGLRVIDAVVTRPAVYLLECGSVCSNFCVRTSTRNSDTTP